MKSEERIRVMRNRIEKASIECDREDEGLEGVTDALNWVLEDYLGDGVLEMKLPIDEGE